MMWVIGYFVWVWEVDVAGIFDGIGTEFRVGWAVSAVEVEDSGYLGHKIHPGASWY